MINPEAIKKRIGEIKDKLRHGQSDDPYYLNGKREGFESCLANIDNVTINSLQTGIKYYEAGNGGSLPYRQGIIDAYIEVGRMVQRDEAWERRNAEVNAATKYARIQQGGKQMQCKDCPKDCDDIWCMQETIERLQEPRTTYVRVYKHTGKAKDSIAIVCYQGDFAKMNDMLYSDADDPNTIACALTSPNII